MRRPWRALPLALLLLSGCGMYGSLYLEEEATAPSVTPEITEQPRSATEEDQDDEDDTAGGS